jgi:hypothetical protein
VCSSAYGSRFRVQGLESGNVDPMRATALVIATGFLFGLPVAVSANSSTRVGGVSICKLMSVER